METFKSDVSDESKVLMIKFEFQMFDFLSISSLGPLLFSGSKKF